MIVKGDHPKPSPLKAVVQGALVPTYGQPIVLLPERGYVNHVREDGARVVLQRTWIFPQVEMGSQHALMTGAIHHVAGENILTASRLDRHSIPINLERCYFGLLPGNRAVSHGNME